MSKILVFATILATAVIVSGCSAQQAAQQSANDQDLIKEETTMTSESGTTMQTGVVVQDPSPSPLSKSDDPKSLESDLDSTVIMQEQF